MRAEILGYSNYLIYLSLSHSKTIRWRLSAMEANRDSGHGLTPAEMSVLSRRVMHKQAVLSLRVAAVFIILILGVPLINFYFPSQAARPVFGFTASWLFLAVLFYPITWALSFYFVKQSDKLEDDAVHWEEESGIDHSVIRNENTYSARPEDPSL